MDQESIDGLPEPAWKHPVSGKPDYQHEVHKVKPMRSGPDPQADDSLLLEAETHWSSMPQLESWPHRPPARFLAEFSQDFHGPTQPHPELKSFCCWHNQSESFQPTPPNQTQHGRHYPTQQNGAMKHAYHSIA